MRTALVFGFVGVVASLSALAQTPNLRPGRYETTSEISMPGSPAKMPPRKDEACITAEDVKDLSRTLAKNSPMQKCTVSNSKVTGTALVFTKECANADGLKMQYTGDVTFTSDAYHAVVHMRDSSGRATNPMLKGSTITVTAKRIGDCTK